MMSAEIELHLLLRLSKGASKFFLGIEGVAAA